MNTNEAKPAAATMRPHRLSPCYQKDTSGHRRTCYFYWTRCLAQPRLAVHVLTLALVLTLCAPTAQAQAPSVFGPPATSPEKLLGACSADGQHFKSCILTGPTNVKGPATVVDVDTTFYGPTVPAATLDELAASRVYLDLTKARGALPVVSGVTLRFERIRVKATASEAVAGQGLLSLLAFPLEAGARLELWESVVELGCTELYDRQAAACSELLPSANVEVRRQRVKGPASAQLVQQHRLLSAMPRPYSCMTLMTLPSHVCYDDAGFAGKAAASELLQRVHQRNKRAPRVLGRSAGRTLHHVQAERWRVPAPAARGHPGVPSEGARVGQHAGHAAAGACRHAAEPHRF